GLGLSTVYGFVRGSQGGVTVDSEPGRGSTFRIYLPLAASEDRRALRPDTAADAARGSETILLVEDQTEVRGVVREALQRAGYSVLPASTGAEALVVAAQHRAHIHLLLTDVVMAGMNGREL